MKLLRMRLENYQGIRKAEFDFNGRSANIYGDNATGKTTLFNAFTWLIFGKASTGANDYTPKTKTQDGDAHNLDHAVECDIEIKGKAITFRRAFHEVWKRTRGATEANLSGHTTDYYIDGVPKKEKEYTRYWESIFDNEEIPKLLSMPFYFAETLHWEKRRSILLDICGVVSDGAIMESDDGLKRLPELLGSRSVDEYKKVIRASLTEINRNIQSIPARIDEAEKAIPNVSRHTSEGLDDQIAAIQENISSAEKDRAEILANAAKGSPARARISELNYALSEDRRRYSERQQAVDAEAFEAIRRLRDKLTVAQSDLNNAKISHSKAVEKVETIEKMRNNICAEHRKKQEVYKATQDEVFDESATICVTCGQPLPVDRVESIRSSFNISKSDRLSALNSQMTALVERGKREASKEMLEAAKQAAVASESALTIGQSRVDSLMKELQEAENKRKQSALPPFEDTNEYKAITAKITAARTEEVQAAPDTRVIDEKIAKYRGEEKFLTSIKAAFETEKAQRARIAELEKQEKELGKSYEEARQALYLCEKFARVKASLLTDRINERFQTVSFQLFKKNITNDGIDDVCEVLIPTDDGKMVPFGLANNAARINAGIEIIGVLSGHYGVELPLFIDNAESVTRITPISGQMIRLIVSESDKQLRLELL